jgi:hypothetical protein
MIFLTLDLSDKLLSVWKNVLPVLLGFGLGLITPKLGRILLFFYTTLQRCTTP